MKLYKYSPPDVFKKMFAREGFVGLKCDLPKNYNDPFELFLSVNAEDAEVDTIAYYLEILGEIPQMPTSCFSKRPDVVPMWAHYGRDHTGYAIEIDEAGLAGAVSLGYIEDIEYSDTMGTVDLNLVNYAATTLKFRHTHRVQTMAFRSAYLTKNRCWEYEMERRLIVNPDDITKINGFMLLFVPIVSVTAIISASRAAKSELRAHRRIAKKIGCPHYQLKIGRASCTPYFTDTQNDSFRFDGTVIQPADFVCDSCCEPIDDQERSTCNWCSVDDGAKADAAFKNPLRMLFHFGLGEGYGFHLAGLRQIGSKTKPKEPTATSQDVL